jgi:t-SNARE syntaxin family protein
MDPFNEVQEDAWSTIGILEEILQKKQRLTVDSSGGGGKGASPTGDLSQDFANNYQELQEIQKDLEQAINISAANPEKFNLTKDDIQQRSDVLHDLQEKIRTIKERWDSPQKQRPVTTMSNRISQDGDETYLENPFLDQMTQYQQQEIIGEQDLQLGSIHDTMKNLNQQATIMGDELEQQGYMLDELDTELDHVANKLTRGVKRVNIFIENNKERASNWCIGMLVVALCILLILVIAI